MKAINVEHLTLCAPTLIVFSKAGYTISVSVYSSLSGQSSDRLLSHGHAGNASIWSVQVAGGVALDNVTAY